MKSYLLQVCTGLRVTTSLFHIITLAFLLTRSSSWLQDLTSSSQNTDIRDMNASECPSGSALRMQDPPSCLQEVSLYLHYFPAREAAAGQHALRKSGTNKTHFLQFPANSYGSRARSNCLRTAPASPNGASLSNSKSEIHLFHSFHQPNNPCHPPWLPPSGAHW